LTLKLCNQTVLYNDIEGDFVSLPFEIAITDVSRVAFKSIARCYFSLMCLLFVLATCFFCSAELVKECNICRFLKDGYFFISTPLPFDFSVLEDVCNFSRQILESLVRFVFKMTTTTRGGVQRQRQRLDTCSKA
jgi:hypothetical protein